MNKHTKKKYPNRQKFKQMREKADFTDMSLFNETTKKVGALELEISTLTGQLAVANKRIKALEVALENSRKVNALAIRAGFQKAYADETPRAIETHRRDLNSLSAEETEQLFAQVSAPEEYVDELATARPETPWRDRVFAPVCALFARKASS